MSKPLLSTAAAARTAFEAVPPGGVSYTLWALLRDPVHASCRMVLIAADEARAEQLQLELNSLGVEDVGLLPGQAHGPFADVAANTEIGFGRSALQHRLCGGDGPRVVVGSAVGWQTRWPPADAFVAQSRRLAVGQILDRDELAHDLVVCGYQRVSLVEDEGTFAVRGGVIDIYVPGRSMPVRLDLFGDELTSIKPFVAQTQRTEASIDSLALFPIREVVYTDASVTRATTRLGRIGEAATLPTRTLRELREAIEQRDYFYGVEGLWPAFYPTTESPLELAAMAPDGGTVLLVLDDPAAIEAATQTAWDRAQAERQRCFERQQPTVEVGDHLSPPQIWLACCDALPQVGFWPLILAREVQAQRQPHALTSPSALIDGIEERRKDASVGEILDPLMDSLRRRSGLPGQTWLCCSSVGNGERLRELLRARRQDLPLVRRGEAPPAQGSCIRVAPGLCSLHDAREDRLLVSDADILGAAPKRRLGKRRRQAVAAADLGPLRDLRAGDLLIHRDHGIGRYLGLKRLILGGIDGDFLHLEYAGGDKLYLPVWRLDRIQAYRGAADTARLDTLGGSRWLRAQQRVKDAVLAIAHQLLDLQAQRQLRPGFALPAPDEAYTAFAAQFPFEETVDQAKAIADVLSDLRKASPMDRLICGDVGFGKTEVALRAAFLAVQGGRQVAVLVPTTVLAEQHRTTFAARLAPFAVQVDVLSRFRSPAQTKHLLQTMQSGQVDVVVGTHRMLSADVHFKNLGLLIVDEEQRFGVKSKERLKQLRQQVHVLTLSATPIPRTLNMAFNGLRDLSLITTPPAERSPIRTEVLRYDEAAIGEAISRELHRGGQVFVVHNRIQTIDSMLQLVRRLCPTASVALAHGQMGATELERIMVGFVRRDYQVLVSTAIIESGIDIPSANTMIVNRADMFGLSQLYQLRGRIGRGRERAYAYLLLPAEGHLNKEATARLSILKRFSELGAGYQIASHDLEQRGAGDLLGADQSGSIAAVGFELYTELLAEAVEQARGQVAAPPSIEPDINLSVAAVLPEAYIPEPMQRLAYYQRMAQAGEDVLIYDVFAEIVDLFGAPPDEAANFCEVMVLRRRLKQLGASALSVGCDRTSLRLGLSFTPTAPIDRAALVRRCQANPQRYRLLPSGRLSITRVDAAGLEGVPMLQEVRNELGLIAIA